MSETPEVKAESLALVPVNTTPQANPGDWRTFYFLLKDKLSYLYQTGLFADLNIEIKNHNKTEIIKCHSLLLKVASPVFESMLSGNFKEKEHIVIEDAEAKIFKIFVKFLYTEKAEFDHIEDVWEVYKVASKYLIAPLQKYCLEYISRNSTYLTACINYNYADSFGLKDIEDKNYKIILKYLDRFLYHGLFNLLSEKGVLSILDEETLCISEGALFSVVSIWINAQFPEKDGQDYHRVIDLMVPKIRFSDMSSKEFSLYVGLSELLDDTTKYKIIMNLTLKQGWPDVHPYTKIYPEKRFVKKFNCSRFNCSCNSNKTSCLLQKTMALTAVELTFPGALVELDKQISSSVSVLSFYFKMNSTVSEKATFLHLKSTSTSFLECSVEVSCVKINYTKNSSADTVTFQGSYYDGKPHFLELNFSQWSRPTFSLDQVKKNSNNEYYDYHTFERITFGSKGNVENIDFCIGDVKLGANSIQFQQDHKRIVNLRKCECTMK